jgi:hypothetical protein
VACGRWGWPKGGIAAWLCHLLGSMRGYRLKMRRRNDRREGSGRAWMVVRVWGERPEAGLRVLSRRCPRESLRSGLSKMRDRKTYFGDYLMPSSAKQL